VNDDSLVRVEHITKKFGGITALNDVSFQIKTGEVVGLIGENGSGKSTMIKILSGVYKSDSGDIYILGRHYKQLNPMRSIQEGIHVIYQDFSLFPNLTVAENIAIPHIISQRRKTINWQRMYEIAKENLEKITSDISLDAEVRQLSAAERQIVAIAKTLVQGARLIIMDEPTTALTRQEVRSLFGIINQLKKHGISVLFVSHKLYEVKEVADRVIIFRDGNKVLDAPMQELDLRTMELHMIGRKIDSEEFSVLQRSENNPELLRVENLSHEPYFSDVSFDVRYHEIVGITGLLGSGQRELALSLFGVLPARSGHIYLDGHQIHIRSIPDAMKNGIGYIPEDRITEGIFASQSVTNNLVVTVVDNLSSRIGVLKKNNIWQTAEKWVRELNVKTQSPATAIQNLSGGNQQKVVIAKWMVSGPKLFILNGPTVGIDVGSKADIHKLIRNMVKEQQIGVILVSDDIPELLHLCDRILLMKQGKLSGQFKREEIDEVGLYQRLLGEI
jgi:simple sugar transport system ATP-binding protein